VLYRDKAVVLRTHKLGEADRIVVLMTESRGKVRAVAKGIRKTKSRFGGRLEPTGHVSLLIHEGRSLDGINQVETIDANRHIREDLDRMGDGLALTEAVDQVAQEGEPNPPLYKMLAAALRTLDEAQERPALLVGAFYWKLLAMEGVQPILDECVVCGDTDLVSFEPVEGGTLCRQHRRGLPIEDGTRELINRVLNGQLAHALMTPDGPPVHAANALATATLEVHLERRLRAARVLREG
jgi:DNA repair protein RecO (recombination protein O)